MLVGNLKVLTLYKPLSLLKKRVVLRALKTTILFCCLFTNTLTSTSSTKRFKILWGQACVLVPYMYKGPLETRVVVPLNCLIAFKSGFTSEFGSQKLGSQHLFIRLQIEFSNQEDSFFQWGQMRFGGKLCHISTTCSTSIYDSGTSTTSVKESTKLPWWQIYRFFSDAGKFSSTKDVSPKSQMLVGLLFPHLGARTQCRLLESTIMLSTLRTTLI